MRLWRDTKGEILFLRWSLPGVNMLHVLTPQVFNRDKELVIDLSYGLTGKNLKILTQVHGVLIKDEEKIGDPFEDEGDGLFSKGIYSLGILTADCLPLLLWNEDRIALLHVGWKGFVAGIVNRGVSLFCNKKVLAALGPCIRGCCYQVDDAFLQAVEEAHPDLEYDRAVSNRNRAIYFDIPEAVKGFLRKCGVEVIEDCGLCTFCSPEFPSYRRDGAKAGRMLTLAWIGE